MGMIVRPMDTEEDLVKYSRFAAVHHGSKSYQASPEYPRWLIRSGHGSGLGAFDDHGELSGAIFAMRTEEPCHWQVLHNLMVNPQLRGGLGFLLVKRAIRQAQATVIPGVTGRFAEIYPVLKARQVPTVWLQRSLNPVRALPAQPRWVGSVWLRPALIRGRLKGLNGVTFRRARIVTDPLSSELRLLSRRLYANQETRSVDEAWLRWRLFSPSGPMTVLLWQRDALCVMSLGWVQRGAMGVPAARVLTILGESETRDELIETSAALASRLGAVRILATMTDGALADAMTAQKYTRYSLQPRTFLLAGGTENPPLVWDPLLTDLGFEGISRTRQ